uniref:Uncharacterized protein n=1 Tax=Oryza glumipatula TaxID=40148 RepID=A0A0D9Z7S0_9ORYZ
MQRSCSGFVCAIGRPIASQFRNLEGGPEEGREQGLFAEEAFAVGLRRQLVAVPSPRRRAAGDRGWAVEKKGRRCHEQGGRELDGGKASLSRPRPGGGVAHSGHVGASAGVNKWYRPSDFFNKGICALKPLMVLMGQNFGYASESSKPLNHSICTSSEYGGILVTSNPFSLKKSRLSAVAPPTAKLAPCWKSSAIFPRRNGGKNGSPSPTAARMHSYRGPPKFQM